MLRTCDLQESICDAETNLWGGEVSHVQVDPPLVLLLTNLLAGLMHRSRDVGHKQRSGYVPRPSAGCQTPLEPVHIHPPRVPWLQERRQANILIEKPAGLPPFSQGVRGAAAWHLCFGLLSHVSRNKITQNTKKGVCAVLVGAKDEK